MKPIDSSEPLMCYFSPMYCNNEATCFINRGNDQYRTCLSCANRLAPPPKGITSQVESSTWPAVLAFARLMDARLQEIEMNVPRVERIRTMDPEDLTVAYGDAITRYEELSADKASSADEIRSELVDAAVYAMMLAEACGGLDVVK